MTTVVFDPATIGPWLEVMRHQRWTFAYHPNRENVQALAALHEFRSHGTVDVAIITSPTYAVAYRGVLTASSDPFAPDFILWAYSDSPVHVLRAALAMPAPGLQGAPTVPRPVPEHLARTAACFVRTRSVRPPQ